MTHFSQITYAEDSGACGCGARLEPGMLVWRADYVIGCSPSCIRAEIQELQDNETREARADHWSTE